MTQLYHNEARERVLELLSSGNWVSTVEINEIGGTDGTRRLRELRSLGFNIEKRKIDSRYYQYRLLPGEVIINS